MLLAWPPASFTEEVGVLVVCGGPVGAIVLSLLFFFPPTGCRPGGVPGGAALGGLPASVLSRVNV